MRMRLFLIFHLERCFEEFQHCTAYFMKTDLLFSLDGYFDYTIAIQNIIHGQCGPEKEFVLQI